MDIQTSSPFANAIKVHSARDAAMEEATQICSLIEEAVKKSDFNRDEELEYRISEFINSAHDINLKSHGSQTARSLHALINERHRYLKTNDANEKEDSIETQKFIIDNLNSKINSNRRATPV